MMPHVDEGTLHALIDGALRAEDSDRAAEVERHLSGCEDCRARLEAAAELRDDASRILGDAIPPALASSDAIADSADFDEVVARAGEVRAGRTRRRAAVRRQLGWTRGVAWAATLVIALGTGYLLRDMIGPDGSPQAAQLAESARQDAPAAPDAPGSGIAEDRGEEADAASAEAGPPPVEPEASATGEPPLTGGDANALADAAEAPGAEAPDPAAPDLAAAERDDREDQMEAARRSALREEAVELAGQEALGRVDQQAAADRPAAGPAAEAPIRWTAGTVPEARAALDGPLYVLPRATLLEVYLMEDAPVAAVLTLQRLESGVPVRVVQRRRTEDDGAAGVADMDADPAADTDSDGRPGPEMPDSETARVILDPYVLVIEGTLPAELLSILGEGARPAP